MCCEAACASPRAEAADGSADKQALLDACLEELDQQSGSAAYESDLNPETTLKSGQVEDDVPLQSADNKVHSAGNS